MNAGALRTHGATALVCVLVSASALQAQTFSYRGFIEFRTDLYLQEVQSDEAQAVVETLFRYEPSVDVGRRLRVRGSFDARLDSYEQVDRAWNVDIGNRGRARPALAIRSLNATIDLGPLTADVGKQFVRWGKADIVNPTDRFAPRDFLGVIDNDFLAITAFRLAWGTSADSVEALWAPWFTPSRIPLYDKRWTVLPDEVADFDLLDLGAVFPGGRQIGARWSHLASGYEYSMSFYDGYDHLPLIDAQVFPTFAPPPILALSQRFARLRMVGADLAWPMPWFTVKVEAGYLTSPDEDADEYAQYVIQVERQTGELFVVGGYAGESVAIARVHQSFAPDRGLTRAFLGRASYTIDTNRRVAAEAAVRRDLRSFWLKGEYSQAAGGHWRTTVSGSLIRGEPEDFIGQYRRNSHVSVALRYSF